MGSVVAQIQSQRFSHMDLRYYHYTSPLTNDLAWEDKV
jgi:hypothetical protein